MKKYISIVLLTLVIAGSSCNKNYLNELAVNPNTPAITTPNLALAGALKTTAGLFNGSGYYMYSCWMGYLSWSTGYQPNVSLESYQITNSTYDVWTSWYLNLSNYNAMLGSTSLPNYQAIGLIMEAYVYESLVDNYNNIPFSQALQGATNLTPAYDSGSAVYDAQMASLDNAIKLIQNAPAGSTTPGTSDVMFGGTMSKWLLFANTLKLRYAIRQTNVTSKTAAIKADIATTSALGYLTADATVNPAYTNVDANGGQQAPLDLTYGYNQSGTAETFNAEFQANTYFVNFCNTNSDPRLTQIYATSTGGVVVSTAFGVTQPPVGSTPSKYSAFMLSPTKAAVLFSAAESYFLQAEAAQAGYITGTPATLYNSGITASFTSDGLTAAQAATYYGQAAIAYPTAGTAAAQEQAIITQKWAALNPYGPLEAFNEMRRTGYPVVPVSVLPGSTATTQPTRIPYPLVELSTNANNVAAQGTINIFTSKIFWAK